MREADGDLATFELCPEGRGSHCGSKEEADELCFLSLACCRVGVAWGAQAQRKRPVGRTLTWSLETFG